MLRGQHPRRHPPLLGPVYIPCPYCFAQCNGCRGYGLFPADYACLGCLVENLIRQHLAPVFCPTCSGVVDLINMHTPPEVNLHVLHHH
ncbi:hypothetical protein [Phytohabitans rumicis]|uniref:Uncharacterized protein n=1 Tax=Phytohabitans rumicis TaxID=1076125 RepID=A0A6V8KZE0_9ACTN|nr:hypothetical protein [Phytohabitans rumicis]GFJ87851.1 hypothetical protein Prum_014930 [Phytohabitans rumicis]